MKRRGSPEEDFASTTIIYISGKLSCTFELLCPRNDEAQVKPNPDVRRGWLQEAGRLSVLQERDRGGGEAGDVAVWRAALTVVALAAFSHFSVWKSIYLPA